MLAAEQFRDDIAKLRSDYDTVLLAVQDRNDRADTLWLSLRVAGSAYCSERTDDIVFVLSRLTSTRQRTIDLSLAHPGLFYTGK